MARDFTVEWSLGKPAEFHLELWHVEATVLAILEATAHKNEDLTRLLAALVKKPRETEQV